MTAPLSPNLRAAIAAHAPHGIDAIDARDIVAAASSEPDFIGALAAIRDEFGACFTQSGRICFERAENERRGGGVTLKGPSTQTRKLDALHADLVLWRSELEREHERKRHAFLLGSLFGFPGVAAAAVALIVDDERRIQTLGDAQQDVHGLLLESMRVEQLVEVSRDATHRLMQLLSSREPQLEATAFLTELCAHAPTSLRMELRSRGAALCSELAKKAHPQGGLAEKQLWFEVTSRLAPIAEGN